MGITWKSFVNRKKAWPYKMREKQKTRFTKQNKKTETQTYNIQRQQI